MVDFGYYSQVYMGSRIPEAAFPEFALRARDSLERLARYYGLTGTKEAIKLALCAMAEEIYSSTGRRGGVSSASVGSVNVKYKDRDRALYDCATAYLDIYRGTSQMQSQERLSAWS